MKRWNGSETAIGETPAFSGKFSSCIVCTLEGGKKSICLTGSNTSLSRVCPLCRLEPDSTGTGPVVPSGGKTATVAIATLLGIFYKLFSRRTVRVHPKAADIPGNGREKDAALGSLPTVGKGLKSQPVGSYLETQSGRVVVDIGIGEYTYKAIALKEED